MGKEHYIEELKEQLHEIMERPVTLGRAEEVMVYADAICALRRMEGRGEAEGFTEDDAKAWTAKMENEDGTTGPHWTMGQTDAVANVAGDEHDVFGLLFRSNEIRPRPAGILC
mgnify:CR=1 FL=1